ncbi:DUF371 domain-containing protein [Halobellus inordinatus]|uniref:DUF371 domain-containing protein n=1 Tax=Halobellus inordinatus TaxID=1126236 RepID=UPI002115BF5E|nr:DUF371 domain-containing protein [Halobellus ramosii]
MREREVVHARGHENVTAEHSSTFEVTSDDWLTPAGDCILAVEADRVPADFDDAFVEACRDPEATIIATLTVTTDEGDTYAETVEGRGHPDLVFENERSHVGRTSDYVDDRTILVGADAAAADFDRELVDALAAGADVRFELVVERDQD